MSGGELSGVDLARVALRAALETARKNGGNARTSKPKPRTMSVVRHDGREPKGRPGKHEAEPGRTRTCGCRVGTMA